MKASISPQWGKARIMCNIRIWMTWIGRDWQNKMDLSESLEKDYLEKIVRHGKIHNSLWPHGGSIATVIPVLLRERDILHIYKTVTALREKYHK